MMEPGRSRTQLAHLRVRHRDTGAARLSVATTGDGGRSSRLYEFALGRLRAAPRTVTTAAERPPGYRVVSGGAAGDGGRPAGDRVVSGGTAGDGGRPADDRAVSAGAAGDAGRALRAAASGGDAGLAGVLSSVEAVEAAVAGVDLDALADADVRELLRAVQRGLDRLGALRVRAAGALESRAVRAAGPGRESRAVRPTRQFLTDELRLAPSEAKQVAETGRRLERASAPTQRAFDAGRLRPEHARIVADTIRWVDDPEQLEQRLLAAAGEHDPVSFGRLARRYLAEHDQNAAVAAAQRRHQRRYARTAQTPDGMVTLSANVAGVDGELVQTAIHAFRRRDAQGERRTAEQATADALVEVCAAALRSRAAPTQHGERPHVSITVAARDLADRTGVASMPWTGPVPVTEIAHLVPDSKLTWVTVDDEHVPRKVAEGRQTIRSAVWKALLARDRGCRWPGCSAPPAWCDVAHAEVPDRAGGAAVISNLALLCRRHHRLVDLGRWTMRIRGPDVIFDPPAGSRHNTLTSTRTGP
jgi:hypothetical protein